MEGLFNKILQGIQAVASPETNIFLLYFGSILSYGFRGKYLTEQGEGFCC